MSSVSYALTDSATMLRRNLRHIIRYPAMSVQLIIMPIIFLLLFVYVFGGSLGAGIGGASGSRSDYVDYVTPGILLMTVIAPAIGVAVSVAMDMTEGIVNRFRTMAISRASVLTGHVVATMVQALLSLAVVAGIAVLVGFRPTAGVANWLAAIGILALLAFALIWLCVAFGLAAKTVESASNAPMPLMLLPFLGSGFVPTDSMPTGLRWFAEYQPFTPIINALRGLLLNGHVGNNAVIAVAWCAGIALVGYLWAKKLFTRPVG